MVFTFADLEESLGQIREHGKAALESYDQEFQIHHDWLNTTLNGLKHGTANIQCPLVTKTPRKKKTPLETVTENAISTKNPVAEHATEIEVVKRGRGRPRKVSTQPQVTSFKEEKEVAVEPNVPQSYHKRLNEEQIESTSKRICANSTFSKTISRDSGLSTGSQNRSTSSAGTMKEEPPTPRNIYEEHHAAVDEDTESGPVLPASPKLFSSPVPNRKSSYQLVKNEPKSPQSSIYGTPADQLCSEEEKAQIDKGTSLSHAQTTNVPSSGQLRTPSMSPLSNTPSRVSRATSRSLVKPSVEHEKSYSKGEDSFSNTQVPQQETSNNITIDNDHHLQNQKTPMHSKIFLKPFASASRIPQLFFQAASPFVNRLVPLTPSFQRSNSFTASSSTNLVTSVQSFLPKQAVNDEVDRFTRREEDYPNMVAKTELAARKKAEMMKARMEEKMRIREEKRLKVIAQREAKEKEKLENKKKMDQLKEARQKQIQAERDENIRQENLRKKLLAEKKAAQNEERRRQEEEAKLTKLKQQEEESLRAAALRRKEQEAAQQKLKERMQQEHEAAAYRAKEAEVRAKQALSKSQLEHASSSAPQSFGKKKPQTKLNSNNTDSYCIDAGTDDSSDDEKKPKKSIPLWAQGKMRVPRLLEDHNISQSQIFHFFGTRKSTPDLGKMFVGIDRRQLLRKSSAVWRTPPKDNA